MADISENINLNQTLQQWAKFTVSDWEKQIARFENVADNNAHLERKVRMGKDTGEIDFSFLFHLRFWQWGVGKGVKIDDVKSHAASRKAIGKMAGNIRRPMPWFGKKYRFNIYRLEEIIAAQYANEIPKGIVTMIKEKE